MTWRIGILCGLAFLFLFISLRGLPAPDRINPDDLKSAGQHNCTINLDGYNREFIVYIPASYRPHHEAPLVFFFHGAGGTAKSAVNIYGWREKADKEGFIVVFPQGLPVRPESLGSFLLNPNVWRDHRPQLAASPIDDIHFFKVMLDQVTSCLAIDSNRVYVTGFSNGGGMTFLLGAACSDKIAAIAPFSTENPQSAISPIRPISLLYMTGTKDPLNPIAGGPTRMPWGNTIDKATVQHSLDQWIAWDGCPAGVKETLPDGVTRVTYSPGKASSELVAYFIDGMGHHWSGSVERLPQSIIGPVRNPIQATDIVWDFFAAHPLSP